MVVYRIVKLAHPWMRIFLLQICTLSFPFSPSVYAQIAPIPPSIPAPSQTETPPAAASKPTEISAGEERMLRADPVLRQKGKTKWDDGFKTLTQAFSQLQAEVKRFNLTQVGMPHLYFIESDDVTFTYEAYIKLATPQDASVSPVSGVELGQSPQGRVLLFPYEGTYNEIDAAYEAIAAWMDDKGLVATGSFIEEYQNIPPSPDDPALRVTIFVFVK